MVTQSLTLAWVGNPSVTATVDVTSDGEDNRSIAVPGFTDAEVKIGWGANKLKSIYILSDLDVILQTNHNGTQAPDDLYQLKAGCPFVWYEDSGLDCPFDTSKAVNRIFLLNDNTADATVVIKTVIDATP